MRTIIRAGLAATAVLCSAVAALPAYADPGSSGRSGKPTAAPRGPAGAVPSQVRAQMTALRPVRAASDRVQAAIYASHAKGLSAITVDAAGVDVHWKGPMPTGLLARLIRAAGPVPVHVRPAEYSYDELLAAHDKLFRAIVTDPAGPVYAVGVKPDGSGLNAYVRPGASMAASTLPAVGVAVFPVTSSGAAPVGTGTRPAAAHTASLASPCDNDVDYCRAADIDPYWGGAHISTPITAHCTTGWAVHSTVDSRQYILTAGHCANSGPQWGDVGDTVWVDQLHLREIGKVRYKITWHDVELIEAPGSAGIYTGNFTDGVANPVGGWELVRANLPVCVSGAMTAGVLCDYTVMDLNVSGVFGGERYESLVLAKSPGYQPCTLEGDSGAPVFTLDGYVVWADGTLTGVDEFDCHYMYFQDFATAAADFHITADSIYG
jgi:hypothetical protein